MIDFLPDFISNLLVTILIFCGVATLLAVATFYYMWRKLTDWTAPDVSKLSAQYGKIKAQSATDPKALKKIIRQQSFKAGVVGAITSFGGFYTLPIALPVDIYLSTQIQATLVEFIATQYGQTNASAIENRAKAYLVTTGSVQVTERTSALIMKYAVRFLGKSFAKLIPFIGAAVGFIVNYSIAMTTGNLAIQWYSGKTPQN